MDYLRSLLGGLVAVAASFFLLLPTGCSAAGFFKIPYKRIESGWRWLPRFVSLKLANPVYETITVPVGTVCLLVLESQSQGKGGLACKGARKGSIVSYQTDTTTTGLAVFRHSTFEAYLKPLPLKDPEHYDKASALIIYEGVAMSKSRTEYKWKASDWNVDRPRRATITIKRDQMIAGPYNVGPPYVWTVLEEPKLEIKGRKSLIAGYPHCVPKANPTGTLGCLDSREDEQKETQNEVDDATTPEKFDEDRKALSKEVGDATEESVEEELNIDQDGVALVLTTNQNEYVAANIIPIRHLKKPIQGSIVMLIIPDGKSTFCVDHEGYTTFTYEVPQEEEDDKRKSRAGDDDLELVKKEVHIRHQAVREPEMDTTGGTEKEEDEVEKFLQLTEPLTRSRRSNFKHKVKKLLPGKRGKKAPA